MWYVSVNSHWRVQYFIYMITIILIFSSSIIIITIKSLNKIKQKQKLFMTLIPMVFRDVIYFYIWNTFLSLSLSLYFFSYCFDYCLKIAYSIHTFEQPNQQSHQVTKPNWLPLILITLTLTTTIASIPLSIYSDVGSLIVVVDEVTNVYLFY